MKNRIVELERFIACCIIFFYHCGGHFGSGWIVVEFFFLLTGYFATQHYETHKLHNVINLSVVRKYLNKCFKFSRNMLYL